MKPVTPELLRRYAAGTLSDADQHRVERAALEDPFVADALDGFLAMAGLSVPLEELQARLDRRTRPARRLGGWVPLATAAGLAGVLFLGYSLFFKTQTPLRTEMATKQSPPPVLKDSVAPAPPVPMATAPPVAYALPKAQRSKRDASPPPQPVTASDSPQMAVVTAPKLARKTMTLGSPDGFQPHEDTVSPQALQGKFAADSGNVKIRISGGVSSPKDALVPGADSSGGLSEVVVIRYPASAKRAPVPFGGIDDFEAYVSAQRRIPQQEPPIGKVIVQFRVSADSTLSRLRLVKSLGRPYDDEALRLVREGPRWLPDLRKGKPVSRKARVEIPF